MLLLYSRQYVFTYLATYVRKNILQQQGCKYFCDEKMCYVVDYEFRQCVELGYNEYRDISSPNTAQYLNYVGAIMEFDHFAPIFATYLPLPATIC